MMHYQVGGSLSRDVLTYVKRQADNALETALNRNEFCYILDSRQMGKSSLLVRAKAQMEAQGGLCMTLDLTNLGSRGVSAEQWYQGIGAELCLGLNLLKTLAFLTWWQEQGELPNLQKLSRLISEVLLPQYPQTSIYIFVDEVDSVLSLDFAADDWFALIRYCYNQRAIDDRFHQLTFVLAGVATPADLIADKTRTPFNIGYGIELQGLQLKDMAPLASGLVRTGGNVDALMQAILRWTGGQPFLTQKLCQLVTASQNERASTIPPGHEDLWVEKLVSSYIINRWESQDEPEHLRTIRDRLLRNEQRAGRLLGLYQKLLAGEAIATDDSREQTELLLSGLVIRQQGTLQIKNPIYKAVFKPAWVEQQFANLRPYAAALQAWQMSGKTDESRLLRGQALQDAQHWAQGKSLDDLDYQFLAVSDARDRQEAEQQLELAQAKEAEARLYQERRASRLQRYLLGSVSVALIASIGLGLTAFMQSRHARQNEYEARLSEIKALIAAAEGDLASNQTLDAMLGSIRAKQRVQDFHKTIPPELADQADTILHRAVYAAQEINRFSGAASGLWSLDWGAEGETLVSVGGTTDIQVWQRDGTLLWSSNEGNVSPYVKVKFSPDGQQIAVGGQDGQVRLYTPDGEPTTALIGHAAEIYSVDFSPDGKTIASSSSDGTIKLWDRQGQVQATLTTHKATVVNLRFSSDGQYLASTSQDNTVRLWQVDGTPIAELVGHETVAYGVDLSANGQMVVSGDADGVIKIWQLDNTTGQLVAQQTLDAHGSWVRDIKFSPEGQTFASASADGTIKLWDVQGRLLQVLAGHQGGVYDVIFSADGQQLFSASEDKTIRVWQLNHPLKTVLTSSSPVFEVVVSPDSQTIASAHTDSTVHLWQPDGTHVKTLQGHNGRAFTLAFSPDGQQLASGSSDRTINLWSQAGELEQTLTGHESSVMGVRFTPDGETLISGSIQGHVSIWDTTGQKLQTLEQAHGILGLDLSTDGQQLAIALQNNQVALKKLDNTLLTTLDVGAVIPAFSPDDNTIATANWDGTVQLWQVNGELLHTLSGHTGEVYDVDFSPDGRWLASGSADKTVRLWSLEGQLLETLYGHTSKIEFTDFSPDGSFLVSGSADQTAIVWQLDEILELDDVAFACSLIADYLRTSPEIEESDRTLCNQ